MQYHVRTAYGVSTSAFSNFLDWVLGIMQGAGHSCTLWALNSSVMFDQMEKTPGATFHSPHPATLTQRPGEAFVDDTSLWILKLGILLPTTIMLMRTAQRWERLLHATGGALNLTNCFWYGIEWTFNKAGAPKMVKDTTNGPTIQLTSGSAPDRPERIQRISTNKGQRTLGVRLAPDGNDKDEYTYRMQQAKQMGQ
jgi:hypothetical protein